MQVRFGRTRAQGLPDDIPAARAHERVVHSRRPIEVSLVLAELFGLGGLPINEHHLHTGRTQLGAHEFEELEPVVEQAVLEDRNGGACGHVLGSVIG